MNGTQCWSWRLRSYLQLLLFPSTHSSRCTHSLPHQVTQNRQPMKYGMSYSTLFFSPSLSILWLRQFWGESTVGCLDYCRHVLMRSSKKRWELRTECYGKPTLKEYSQRCQAPQRDQMRKWLQNAKGFKNKVTPARIPVQGREMTLGSNRWGVCVRWGELMFSSNKGKNYCL